MPLWVTIIYLIFSGLFIYAIAKLFGKKEKRPAISSLTIYILISIVFLAIWIFDLKVPHYIILLTMLSVFMTCFFGLYMEWFSRSKVFDRYVHALTSFSVALLTYCLIENLFVEGGSNAFRAVFVFTIGMTLGATFELIEAAHDTKSNIKDQKGLKDTNADLIADLIGSLLAGVFAYIFLFR